jgi:hypothetical protein
VQFGNGGFVSRHLEVVGHPRAVLRIDRPRQEHGYKFALARFRLAPEFIEIVVAVPGRFLSGWFATELRTAPANLSRTRPRKRGGFEPSRCVLRAGAPSPLLVRMHPLVRRDPVRFGQLDHRRGATLLRMIGISARPSDVRQVEGWRGCIKFRSWNESPSPCSSPGHESNGNWSPVVNVPSKLVDD